MMTGLALGRTVATLTGEGDRRAEVLLDGLEREVPEAFLPLEAFEADVAVRAAFSFDRDVIVPYFFVAGLVILEFQGTERASLARVPALPQLDTDDDHVGSFRSNLERPSDFEEVPQQPWCRSSQSSARISIRNTRPLASPTPRG